MNCYLREAASATRESYLFHFPAPACSHNRLEVVRGCVVFTRDVGERAGTRPLNGFLTSRPAWQLLPHHDRNGPARDPEETRSWNNYEYSAIRSRNCSGRTCADLLCRPAHLDEGAGKHYWGRGGGAEVERECATTGVLISRKLLLSPSAGPCQTPPPNVVM